LKITTSKLLWIAEEKEDPMTRGKRAPLSPHEEVTLRRIALGITQAPHLSKSDIKRLKALSLIEENGGGLGLTPMGRALSLPCNERRRRSVPFTGRICFEAG